MIDVCTRCGCYVPEGRMVCPICERMVEEEVADKVAHKRIDVGSRKWMPVAKYGAPDYARNLVCVDKFGQMFFPIGVVQINGVVYDGNGFRFDIKEFLKGEDDGNGVRILPREIIAWRYIEPYKEVKD